MLHLIRLISTTLFSLLAIGFLMVLLRDSGKIVEHPQPYYGLLAGVIVYYFINRLNLSFLQENIQWLRVFTHELIHAFISFLSFKKINSLEATQRQGGKVTFYGKSNLFISLTPYCFPLYTVMLLFLRPLIKVPFLFYFNIFVGLSYAFHLHTFFLQSGKHQLDFQERGIIQSYSFTIMLNLYFLGVVLWSSTTGIHAFAAFFLEGVSVYSFLWE